MLEVINFTKRYKKTDAVDDISFTLQSGDVVGLLGPNGAGKSTTMKAIAGLIRKTQGSIKIEGFDHRTKEAKKLFSYVPEVPELYDMLTVKEHVQFISYGYDVKDWEEKANILFKQYDLLDKQDKLAKELSKGMKQKVSICCGLITNPQIYLFDEPMIGLDPKAIRTTKENFKELSSQGKIIFISTHLLDSIENLCNRVLVMKSGSIIADGSVANLREKLGNGSEASLEELFLEVTKDE